MLTLYIVLGYLLIGAVLARIIYHGWVTSGNLDEEISRPWEFPVFFLIVLLFWLPLLFNYEFRQDFKRGWGDLF